MPRPLSFSMPDGFAMPVYRRFSNVFVVVSGSTTYTHCSCRLSKIDSFNTSFSWNGWPKALCRSSGSEFDLQGEFRFDFHSVWSRIVHAMAQVSSQWTLYALLRHRTFGIHALKPNFPPFSQETCQYSSFIADDLPLAALNQARSLAAHFTRLNRRSVRCSSMLQSQEVAGDSRRWVKRLFLTDPTKTLVNRRSIVGLPDRDAYSVLSLRKNA